MQAEDREAFGGYIAMLFAAFGKSVDALGIRVWWEVLKDLPIDEVHDAVGRATKECHGLPAPAKLRELAGVPSLESRCEAAFSVFLKAVRDRGAPSSVDLDDPLSHAAIRSMGGWVLVNATMTTDNFNWKKKEFRDAYMGYANMTITEEQANYLPGVHEQNNAGLDYPVPISFFKNPLPPYPVKIVKSAPTKFLPVPETADGAEELISAQDRELLERLLPSVDLPWTGDPPVE